MMKNPAETVDSLFSHLCMMLTLTPLRSFRFTIEIFTHSMKKKMMSFLAGPIYHARSLPQMHRTKVQF
jgi:hypothetical protein